MFRIVTFSNQNAWLEVGLSRVRIFFKVVRWRSGWVGLGVFWVLHDIGFSHQNAWLEVGLLARIEVH